VRGMTLVEIAFVVMIVGILAAMAIPAIKQAQLRTRASVLANDLRVFSEAFNRYCNENARWPSETRTGVVPVGMAPYLPTSRWTRITPIGGYYDWDYRVVAPNGKRVTAMISIRPLRGATLSISRQDLLTIDRKIDDGNLTTGNLCARYPSAVSYILEK
jgi:prepilin-type N-terminal cleavage/methylation domain-containing protein